MKKLIPAVCLLLSTFSLKASDTVYVKASDLNTRVLIPGTHRWLVYFKMGKDSTRKLYSLWTRKIDLLQYEGRNAISVTQEWEDKDSVSHTAYTVCDSKDFSTLYHESWWKQTGKATFDFLKKEMTIGGKKTDAADKDSVNLKRFSAFTKATGEYFLNWHLDLEVFPQLPFRNNTTFMINYYDPGFSAPQKVPYTVTGSAALTGYDQQKVDCWLLEHNSKNNHEVFWISKKTREVLKLEQEFAGRYRYKIKLGFSM
ncbi:hypothetical protein [Sediminibacterium ginsengisoli]|uniref:DUF3108 domain-containing protein n=1 Tax=Sediminibacterium ginsengisoli TaxID=413434 RepID=A0A1T4QSP5_9BACT|nr:hypothetical protein [Sediminibacterium ginsengisoli]SKA06803.1 hypothetical protein SAMN04488132_10983 [Sediminibacterium ginsengisoli]